MNLTVVIPIHNEAPSLRTLAEGIMRHAEPRPLQILFVDDGSTDDSMHILRALHSEHPCVGYLRFSRNVGKSEALAAAFRRVHADIVVTMDGDLQDDPAELPRMIAAIEDNTDLVCGWKENRRDPWHKTMPSLVFNRVLGGLFGLKLHDMNTGFKAMRGEVVARLALTHGMHRFIPVLASQLGYTVAEIPVLHHPRRHGKSNYGFERYYQGARDALWLRLNLTRNKEGLPPEPAGLVVEAVMGD